MIFILAHTTGIIKMFFKTRKHPIQVTGASRFTATTIL